MLVKIKCKRCKRFAKKESGLVNRARRLCTPLYCGRKCAGLARRSGKTKSQLVEEKRIYDADYRVIFAHKIKRRKEAYYIKTYDPAKAAIERKKRAPKHLEYCRRPEYKKWKREYDRNYRALKQFGEFAEAFLALSELNIHIKELINDYETRQENGTFGKTQKRRHQDGNETSRYRYKTADRSRS